MAQNTNFYILNNGVYKDLKYLLKPGISSTVTKFYTYNGARYADIGELFNPYSTGTKQSLTNLYFGGVDLSNTFDKVLKSILNDSVLYAYSVRLIIPYYTGPVIRIRRSSDNVESDFYSDISQNWFTTGANNTGTTYANWIGADTGYVTVWYDQGDSRRHATQPTAANQPTLNFTDFNIYVVSFSSSGSGTWLTIPTFTGGTNTFFSNFYTLNASSTYNTLLSAAIGTDLGLRLSNNSLNGSSSNNIDWYPTASGTKLNYVNNVSTLSVPLTTWNSAALSVETPPGITNTLTTSSVSGLTVSSNTVYTNNVYSFTLSGSSNGTCNVTFNANMNIQVLIVAGGAGGGYDGGGGGGAGGVIYNSSFAVTSGTSYSIQVGAGGAGTNDRNVVGGSGGNSIFSTLTAIGGGGGSNNRVNLPGSSGGSGGGGGCEGSGSSVTLPGNGTTGQGNKGGNAAFQYAGGGGGGAGAVGGDSSVDNPNSVTSVTCGNGGVGISNSITGSAVYYGGGGGGGTWSPKYISGSGLGGSGGGGNGGHDNISAIDGTSNTGGGGGGGCGTSGNAKGGNGGSGIVIISVPMSLYPLSVIGTDGNSRARGLNGYMSELMGHSTTFTNAEISSFYANQLSISYPRYLTTSLLNYAFSVRLVIPTYTGAIIRIRRSSDNVESDFYSDISQNWLTTAANNTGTSYVTWIGASTGYVTTWYDQSGSGRHATQTTIGNQPQFTNYNLNKYVILFSSSGSGTWLTIPNLTIPSYTFFCNFFTLTSSSTYNTLMCADINTNLGIRLSNQTLNGDNSGNDWYPSTSNVTKLSYVNNVSTVSVPLTTWNTTALTIQPYSITISSVSDLTVSSNTVSTNKVYSFTASTPGDGKCYVSFSANMIIQVLIVAGGGGGGNVAGGGGGGGGVIYNSSFEVTADTSYYIRVGCGGFTGNKGHDSIFGSLIAIGGGGGDARATTSYHDGGSGGGGGGVNGSIGGKGISGQGNKGGSGNFNTGGGGGGAGSAGVNASGYNGGNGGNGISNSITGSAVYYGGGGGGGSTFGSAGIGGLGGGGNGSASGRGINGTANTGGGGGGGGYGEPTADIYGKGGSGIVIISFPSTPLSTLSVIGTDGSSRSSGLNGYMIELMGHNTPLTAKEIGYFYRKQLNINNVYPSGLISLINGSNNTNPSSIVVDSIATGSWTATNITYNNTLNSLNFNGSNSSLYSSSLSNWNNNSFTLIFYINRTINNNSFTIYSNPTGVNSPTYISPQEFSFTTISSSGSSITISAGWSMFTFVKSNLSFSRYVNNSLESTRNAFLEPNIVNMHYIGINSNNTSFPVPFNGNLFFAGIWNRALSTSEITKVYNYLTSIKPA